MKKDLEENSEFNPQFNEEGLIPCFTVSAKNNAILMVAWMNREALDKTIETGELHYWSRSRKELWHKGATSGNVQKLLELRVDCDQDCLMAVVVEAPACHTGRRSCFYRSLDLKNGKLVFTD